MGTLLQKLLIVFKQNWLLIAGAAAMAFLAILPAILYPIMAGTSYQGLNIGNFGEDDIGYFSKGREILDGNPLGNYFLKIGKEGNDPHRVYVEYVLFAPIKFLGLSQTIDIVKLYTALNFIGVFALICLIYWLVLQMSGHKLLGIATSLFVVGGYTFVIFHPIRLSPFTSQFNAYGRPIMPIFGSLVFFIFLNLLVKCLKSEKKGYLILAGLSMGSLFYVYFYTWTFTLALVGILFLVYAVKRDIKQIKKILVVAGIGLAVGSYILIKMFLFFNSDIGKQSSYFFTLQHERLLGPVSKLSVTALLLFFVFVYKKRKNENSLLILALILAGFIVMNQQVITGRLVQPLHYFWYFIIPTVIIVNFYMFWMLVDDARYGRYKKAILILLVAAAFTNTLIRQYRGTLDTFDVKQYMQNYRPIIDALNQDKNPGVILSSERFYGRFLTVFTHHDMFWSQAGVFNTPLQRFEDALFVTCYLNKQSRNNFLSFIASDQGIPGPKYEHAEQCKEIYDVLEGYLSGAVDGGEYNYRMITKDPVILDNIEKLKKQLLEKYQAAIGSPSDLLDILERGGVNYILWDKNRNPDWDLSVIPGLEEITESSGIYLYKLKFLTPTP